MKRKAFVILFAITLIVITAIGMVACENVTGESIEGTYYSYENGSIVKSDYVTLKDGKWVDSDGMDGTYKVSDGKITLYSDLFGEEVVVYEGTIKDGVIKLDALGEDMYFCKEGKTPPNTKPDDGQQNKPNVTKYSVTYNANGGKFSDGSSTYEQSVDENSLLTAPVQPIKQGCSFAGWSKKKSSSDMWKFAEDKITEDITLYAVWTEKTASILSIDGATIEDNSIFMLVNKDTDYVSLATKVVCSSDSTWRLYYDRLGLTEIPTKIATQKTGVLNDGDNIFYIVVTSSDGTQVNTYELKIHRSYLISINFVGVYGTTIDTKTTYTGYEYIVNYNPSISGYTFNYWKNSSGEKMTKFIPYSTTTLYADCTVNTYTATLDVNGGNEISKTKYEINYDSNYTFPKPQRTGYTFLGWYDYSTQLTDSSGKNLSVWKYAGNKNITAHWQANKYTITFNSNDSKAGTLSGGGEHNYDSNITIIANTNSGYTWLGWYDSNNNLVTSDINYTFKMEFDKSFTAKWIKVMLSVNNTSAGSVSSLTGKYKVGEEVTVTTQRKLLGYVFDGWYDGNKKVTGQQSYTFAMPSKNTTYTARWEVDEKLKSFSFSSTANTLIITGLKDKTQTSIEIPDSVTSIGNSAFYDCSSLTSIEIPSRVTSIGKYEFSSCYSLTSITFGENSQLTSIGDRAFSHCSRLTSIEIPSGVTSIGEYAFSSCSRLPSIVIPSSVKSIGRNAFNICSSLIVYCEALREPSGWDSDWDKLSNNEYAPSVWGYNYVIYNGIVYGIKNGVANVVRQSESISGAVEIASEVTYKGTTYNVTSIGGRAFLECRSLTNIEIPNSVTNIGESAFDRCSRLTSIEIPSSVTSIGGSAISWCSSLTSIEIPDSVTSIGSYAFANCSSLTIYCEAESKPSGWDGDWNGSVPVVWNYGGEYGETESGIKWGLTKDGTITIRGYSGTSTEIVIPKIINEYSVTSIGDYAFYGCSSLTSIEIPSSVTSIGKYAFSFCRSLTNIEIPSSVTSIGSYAFEGCSSLTIYCEAESQPSGWDSSWNYSNRPVVWGYKG